MRGDRERPADIIAGRMPGNGLENNAKMKNARLDVEGRGKEKGGLYEILPNVSAWEQLLKANHGMMDMSVIPGLLELSMMDDGLLGGRPLSSPCSPADRS